jgi:hypothetical protein
MLRLSHRPKMREYQLSHPGRLGNPHQRKGAIVGDIHVPPETGASTICAPVCTTCLATSCAIFTSRVVESMHNVPRAAASGSVRRVGMIPLDFKYTVCTCGDDGSMVRMVCETKTALMNEFVTCSCTLEWAENALFGCSGYTNLRSWEMG